MEQNKNNGTTSAAKWKEVLIGGVSGIALGTAGTLFASSIPLEASAETPETPESEDANVGNGGENVTAQMATCVTDSMSFSAAFGAARAKVGPGGVFEWHGNLYGTYTADEWNSMDSDARNEYAESIHWDGPSHEYVAASTSHSAHTYTANHSVADSVCQQQTPPEKDDEETPDVEIIGVEHTNIDGEHDSIIGSASVNGQAVYFIDVDGQDNEFELMVTDANGNQQIDEGEVVDISDQHMSVSHFEEMAQANHTSDTDNDDTPVQYYANNEDLPDYVNDADPGTLA